MANTIHGTNVRMVCNGVTVGYVQSADFRRTINQVIVEECGLNVPTEIVNGGQRFNLNFGCLYAKNQDLERIGMLSQTADGTRDIEGSTITFIQQSDDALLVTAYGCKVADISGQIQREQVMGRRITISCLRLEEHIK